MYAELKTYTRNQIVYSQNEQSDNMYIVKEGEFKVTFVVCKTKHCTLLGHA